MRQPDIASPFLGKLHAPGGAVGRGNRSSRTISRQRATGGALPAKSACATPPREGRPARPYASAPLLQLTVVSLLVTSRRTCGGEDPRFADAHHGPGRVPSDRPCPARQVSSRLPSSPTSGSPSRQGAGDMTRQVPSFRTLHVEAASASPDCRRRGAAGRGRTWGRGLIRRASRWRALAMLILQAVGGRLGCSHRACMSCIDCPLRNAASPPSYSKEQHHA